MLARSLTSSFLFLLAFSSHVVSGSPLAVEPDSVIAPPHIPGIELFNANGRWYHDEAQAPKIVSSTPEPQSQVVTIIEVPGSGQLDILMQQIQNFFPGTTISIEVELDSGAPMLFLAVIIFLLGAYMIYASKSQEDLEGQSDVEDEGKSSTVIVDLMNPLEKEEDLVDGQKYPMIVVDLMV